MCSCKVEEDIVSNSTDPNTSVVEEASDFFVQNSEVSAVDSTSSTALCEHTNCTIKEQYTSYQDALKDYNAVLNILKEHNASSCRDDEKSTQKIQSVLKEIEGICDKLESTNSTVKNNSHKEQEIQSRIDYWEEQNYWAEIGIITTNVEQTKNIYQEILEIQKAYQEKRLSFDEYYEKIMGLKYEDE